MRRTAALVALGAATLVVSCGGSDDGGATPPPAQDRAVAFQIDAAHSGVSGVVAPAFPASAAWTKIFTGLLSYPLIADGKVFVVEAADFAASSAPRLHALDRTSGAAAWTPAALPGTSFIAGHAYDRGKVFVSTFDGLVLSFDAVSGAAGWSTKLPSSYGFVSAPTAAGGVVYLSDGGTNRVVAVDETNGALLWTATVNGGGFSIPSVGCGSVFVAFPCQYYALAAASGIERWHFNGPCSGGGGSTVPYSQGAVYVRDFSTSPTGYFLDARDAGTGTSLASFMPTGVFTPLQIPAITPSAAFLLNGATLQRFDRALSRIAWSFAGDGSLTTAPIVIDDAVVIAGTSGAIYAVDAVSGLLRWSARLPSTIDVNYDFNSTSPVGLAAGEGYLLAPARNTLTAFRLMP